ncbi:unnamed protein product [Cochlearia groenlandica]
MQRDNGEDFELTPNSQLRSDPFCLLLNHIKIRPFSTILALSSVTMVAIRAAIEMIEAAQGCERKMKA